MSLCPGLWPCKLLAWRGYRWPARGRINGLTGWVDLHPLSVRVLFRRRPNPNRMARWC